YLHDIHTSTQRLSTLIDVLLNVSRIEEGRVTISPKPLELIGFVSNYLTECAPLCVKKNLSMTFEKRLEPIHVIVDVSALRNIIQSIISNAIEYTPEGGKVEVSLKKTRDHFIFKVKDTGIGIPKEEQGRIFEKFTRASNAQLIKTDGTGLGLYIAKQAVDLLEGKIWFESEVNKGTTFFVELPIESKAVGSEKDGKALA
ncbi:MAG: multi-sensor signal transduction histidine kinase, partial [Parcubacteria group bacterium Gr01-1014_33]